MKDHVKQAQRTCYEQPTSITWEVGNNRTLMFRPKHSVTGMLKLQTHDTHNSEHQLVFLYQRASRVTQVKVTGVGLFECYTTSEGDFTCPPHSDD